MGLSVGPKGTMGITHVEIDGPGRVWLKFALDLMIWSFAAVLAFPLRMNDPFSVPLDSFLLYIGIGLPVHGAAILWAGLPRQAWRQSTIHDLVHLLGAVAGGTIVMFVVGLLLYHGSGFPRTVPLITGTLALIGMGGVRLLLRLSQERATHAEVEAAGRTKRVLMVGAGSAGAHMARQLRRHPRTGLSPVGFLDDDPRLARVKIGGLPVLGQIEDLPAVGRSSRIEQVLITMPSSPGRVTRRVVDLARLAGVPCRILPGVTQILAGEVSVAEIRPVQVEDLLRRDRFELDLSGEADYLSGHVVLVTGAGGSIGAELVRQVARQDPKRVILFGRGENSLHAIEQELSAVLPDLDHVTVVGSVTDEIKVREVLRAHAPDVVFHAAAHKHVPMMEHHPDEAVVNNIGGTRNIAVASAASGVRRFVNISSDKAVNPVSMVGITKSIAERVVRSVAADAEPGQVFVSVRFGNVLGSRGSVVPIFQEQIRRGGPITLTHPDMTRYFMTIPEASRLVIQAGAFGVNGAVFVLDMGEPVKIRDLAGDMVRLSGADENDIEIVYTGLRPGEKLNEELLTEDERTIATRFEQIMMAQTDYREDPRFRQGVQALIDAASQRDWETLRWCLASLHPGFEIAERDDDRGRLVR